MSYCSQTKTSHLIFLSKNIYKNTNELPTISYITVEAFSSLKRIKSQKFVSYATYNLFGILNNISQIKSSTSRQTDAVRLVNSFKLTKSNINAFYHAKNILKNTNIIEADELKGNFIISNLKRNLYSFDKFNLKALKNILLQKNFFLSFAYCTKNPANKQNIISFLNLTGLKLSS